MLRQHRWTLLLLSYFWVEILYCIVICSKHGNTDRWKSSNFCNKIVIPESYTGVHICVCVWMYCMCMCVSDMHRDIMYVLKSQVSPRYPLFYSVKISAPLGFQVCVVPAVNQGHCCNSNAFTVGIWTCGLVISAQVRVKKVNSAPVFGESYQF